MTEHFWVLVLPCPLTRPSARSASPWSDVVFLPPEARSQPATDCVPHTPHGLVCKTPVTTHACLLGSACTASRRCLLLPKTERPRVWCHSVHNTCPRARACRTSAPTLQTTTSTRPDPRPQTAETTSPAAARYLPQCTRWQAPVGSRKACPPRPRPQTSPRRAAL